jgi:hypothetical protein
MQPGPLYDDAYAGMGHGCHCHHGGGGRGPRFDEQENYGGPGMYDPRMYDPRMAGDPRMGGDPSMYDPRMAGDPYGYGPAGQNDLYVYADPAIQNQAINDASAYADGAYNPVVNGDPAMRPTGNVAGMPDYSRADYLYPPMQQPADATAGDALAQQGLALYRAGDQYGAMLTWLAAEQASPGLSQNPAFLQEIQALSAQSRSLDPNMAVSAPQGLDNGIYAQMPQGAQTFSGDGQYYPPTDQSVSYAQQQGGAQPLDASVQPASLTTAQDASAQSYLPQPGLDASQSAAPTTDATGQTAAPGQPSDQVMNVVGQAVQSFNKGDGTTGALQFMQAAVMDPTLVNNPAFLNSFKQFFQPAAATTGDGTNSAAPVDNSGAQTSVAPTSEAASTAAPGDPTSMARTSQDTVQPVAASSDTGSGTQTVPTDTTTAASGAQGSQDALVQTVQQAFQFIQKGDQADGILMLMKAAMMNPQILQDQGFLQSLAAVEKSVLPNSVDVTQTAQTQATTDATGASVQPADTSGTVAIAPTDTSASPPPADTSSTVAPAPTDTSNVASSDSSSQSNTG